MVESDIASPSVQLEMGVSAVLLCTCKCSNQQDAPLAGEHLSWIKHPLRIQGIFDFSHQINLGASAPIG